MCAVSMKILDFLKRGKERKKSPLPPIRTVRPPGEARAQHQARLAKEIEESGIFETQSEFMDTGPLELTSEARDKSNPYETHSWEMDHEEGLRRVEDQSLVNRKKPQGTAGNPYDTVVKKKGW